MSKSSRRDPTEGTIVCVPLPDGRFAYFCAINGTRHWLYRFLTDYPVRKPEYFATSKWFRPYLVDMFFSDIVDACKIPLTEEEKKLVPLWNYANWDEVNAGTEDPRFIVFDPELRTKRPGTEEEIKDMHRARWLDPHDMAAEVLKNQEKMEFILVPPEDRDVRLCSPTKKRYRRDPKVDTVVRIPLPDGRFAYLCAVRSPDFWLYRFISDYPIRNPVYFAPSKWLRPCIMLRFLADAVDVCKISLSEKDKESIPLWKYGNRTCFEAGYEPPEYVISDPALNGCHRSATAEEVVGMHREEWLQGEDLAPWVSELEHEMEFIHVPPEDRDTRVAPPATDAPDDWAEDEDRIVEIIFPPNHPALADRLEEMEAQFDTELELADCGALNGSGAMEGGGSFDIALDVGPRRLKTALRVIRKVLKRFKVPPETQILEHHPEYEDPIEHPLVTPISSSKKKEAQG